MKVVTLCGSMRFQNEMMEIAEKLAREGECVLTPVYMVMKDCEISEEEVKRLKLEQFKRIELADEIFVVDVDGYVGESTMAEIEFAERNGKRVRWMEERMHIRNKIV